MAEQKGNELSTLERAYVKRALELFRKSVERRAAAEGNVEIARLLREDIASISRLENRNW